ncbi:hypothetical protein L1049_025722 [Liquidambar formosana]|uniref:Uncharacterized protein n=1 Tax=Liquidambar formosana TaxID=63359 RepID=A0AAP0NDC3_LIQFO
MAMKKNRPTTSMKSLWFVLGVMLLVASTQLSLVHCRPLRSTADGVVDAGCKQVDGADSVGLNSFAVSSNNSSSRSNARSLAYKMTSGPSTRGPGH